MATPSVITYVYIRGKWYAFSDVASAREASTKYNGNLKSLRMSKPVGVVVDNNTLFNKMYWPDTIADAEGVTGDALVNPPVNPIYSSQPIPETPVVTVTQPQTPASGGGGGGGGSPDPKKKKKKKVWDFREYVEGTPGLLRAFQNYKKTQDPTKIDKWERHGAPGARLGTGPTRDQLMGGRNRDPNLEAGYTGGELNVEQWGNIHWQKHGKDETRQLKAWKEVDEDDPGYMGRWDQYTL